MSKRRVFVDLAPLTGSRDFRFLFGGQLISILGSQLTVVAVAYQVYHATNSSLDVGLVGLTQLFPLILGSMVGGSISDVHGRRTILLVAPALAAGASAALAISSMTGSSNLWLLYAVSGIQAGLTGLAQPAYSAAIPNVVAGENLASAYALLQLQRQVGTVAGPTVAGLMLSFSTASTVYWCDAGTFVVCSLTIVPVGRLSGDIHRNGRVGWESIKTGWRFIGLNQVVQGVYLFDLNATILGMPRALFPALAIHHFHSGASVVGYLYSAPGAGALAGGLVTGWAPEVRHMGRAVIAAVVVWGLAIAGFGLVTYLPVALVLLALAGWADVMSAIFRNTVLQLSLPDSVRGRLSAMQIAVVNGGPRLGDLEAGAVATAAGDQVSVISGGLGCVVGAVALSLVLPAFRTYSRPTGKALPPDADDRQRPTST